VLLGGCSGDSKHVTADKSIAFSGVKAPETDAEKQSILAADKVAINGKEYAIGFNTILRSGDKPGDSPFAFGTIVDKNGNPIKEADNSNMLSNDNDFSSLLIGKSDSKLYMVSHFEKSPGAMYITELNQDKATGKLTAVRTSRSTSAASAAAGSTVPAASPPGEPIWAPRSTSRMPARSRPPATWLRTATKTPRPSTSGLTPTVLWTITSRTAA